MTLLNMPLRPIIQFAWGINTPSRLAGVPDWANVERFDVIGKAESIPSREAMRPMLQALLAERFKLATHMETRRQPIYALMRARRDDKLGPGLHLSTVTCAGRGRARDNERRAVALHGAAGAARSQARTGDRDGRRPGRRSRRASDRELKACFMTASRNAVMLRFRPASSLPLGHKGHVDRTALVVTDLDIG